MSAPSCTDPRWTRPRAGTRPGRWQAGDRVTWQMPTQFGMRTFVGRVTTLACAGDTFEVRWAHGHVGRFIHGYEPEGFRAWQQGDQMQARIDQQLVVREQVLAELLRDHPDWPEDVCATLQSKLRFIREN